MRVVILMIYSNTKQWIAYHPNDICIEGKVIIHLCKFVVGNRTLFYFWNRKISCDKQIQAENEQWADTLTCRNLDQVVLYIIRLKIQRLGFFKFLVGMRKGSRFVVGWSRSTLGPFYIMLCLYNPRLFCQFTEKVLSHRGSWIFGS